MRSSFTLAVLCVLAASTEPRDERVSCGYCFRGDNGGGCLRSEYCCPQRGVQPTTCTCSNKMSPVGICNGGGRGECASTPPYYDNACCVEQYACTSEAGAKAVGYTGSGATAGGCFRCNSEWPTLPCSAACADEFTTHCLPYHAGDGCTACRAEIEAQIGPLAQHCSAGCMNTASMERACPSRSNS